VKLLVADVGMLSPQSSQNLRRILFLDLPKIYELVAFARRRFPEDALHLGPRHPSPNPEAVFSSAVTVGDLAQRSSPVPLRSAFKKIGGVLDLAAFKDKVYVSLRISRRITNL